jgi:hypothetical protein
MPIKIFVRVTRLVSKVTFEPSLLVTRKKDKNKKKKEKKKERQFVLSYMDNYSNKRMRISSRILRNWIVLYYFYNTYH